MHDTILFYNTLKKHALKRGFGIEILQEQGMGCPPLFLLHKAARTAKRECPHWIVSAGIHGDEPAGPYTLLKLLQEENFFCELFNWTLFPILNPVGFSLGTRENGEGIDLNRDYRHEKSEEVQAFLEWFKKEKRSFDISLTLHEDWEAKGYYMYTSEASANGGLPRVASSILKAVESICPVEKAAFIDGHEAKEGVIQPPKSTFDALEEWPEAIYLIKNNPNLLHFTFESPSMYPLSRRVEAHRAAFHALRGCLLESLAAKQGA